MNAVLRRIVSGFLFAVVLSIAHGQTAAIDQVRTQLTAPSGVIVRSPGLWATTTPTNQPSEIKVTNGKISRGSAILFHGNVNVPIQPGQRLRVAAVESTDDAKSDQLRVIIEAAGLNVPVVFVFSKGALASMDAEQIMATVSPILRPASQNASPRNTPSIVPVPPPAAASLPAFVKWSEPLTGIPTKDVKAACESPRNEDQALCYAVLASFQDAEDMARDAQTKLFSGCVPEGTTAQQLKDAFLAETNAMPDQLLGPVSIFYNRTLDEKFPCPKASPVKPRRPIKK